ncbi:MAG: AAA family ATPase [Clostridiales bacterium]|nr:AAA family ATPase [Clostridiales bacterium]
MRYIDGVKTIPPTEANNALILGTAIHTGIEKSLEETIKEYCFSFPIITDEHINEIIKFQKVIPLARESIPENGKFEVEIATEDFHGFIDYLVPACHMSKDDPLNQYRRDVDVYDIYDFKYSNNVQSYMDSDQLHLYKYFLERMNPNIRIRYLFLVFIPKVQIKQKNTETIIDFRRRLEQELENVNIRTICVEFDYHKVIEFLLDIKKVTETTDFPKQKSYLCRFCEFQDYCEKGWNYMKLPENKRRKTDTVDKRVMWIYGVPFCGKTTFANNFPEPLMLNTDGNAKPSMGIDSPVIFIKDEIRVEGRQTKRILAWEIFKDAIAELEKKDNDFKTIVVDLLEDLYEHCRLYMYQQMGISHESDDGFRAWDKVRGEFLNTLKRLINLDYENIILISHEDTSKDITKKGGDKITAIKPNLQDKVANKVAGMVDIVARIVADDEVRTFNFKSNEMIFGGGRLKTNVKSIPLDVNALFEVYDKTAKSAGNKKPEQKVDKAEKIEEDIPKSEAEKPKRSRRRTAEPKPEISEEAVGAEPDISEDSTPLGEEKAKTDEAVEAKASEPAQPTRRRTRRTRA